MGNHFRNTLLAGVFAAIPVGILVFLGWYVEVHTQFISVAIFGYYVPALGVLLAIAAVYALGLVVRSLIGQLLLGLFDRMLLAIPVLRNVYAAWKQVSLTNADDSVYNRVVLVPAGPPGVLQLGFSSGRTIGPRCEMLCVFIPGAPNPINGRIYFVHERDARYIDMGVEEAFKLLLSGANYVPERIAVCLEAKA